MRVKYWLISSLVMLSIFAICCVLITFAHRAISESALGTNVLLGVTAISLFSWPLLLAHAFQKYRKGH